MSKSWTFREGDDVVVLVAEAAVAVPEALADDVAGGVPAPPLGVAAGGYVGLRPALGLGLGVEKSRPILVLLFLFLSL